MVNFGDALRKGIDACYQPKLWVPLFIVDLAAFFTVAYILLGDLQFIVSLMEGSTSPMLPFSVMTKFITVGVIGLVWYIMKMMLMGLDGAVAQQNVIMRPNL